MTFGVHQRSEEMSLDIYLHSKDTNTTECSECGQPKLETERLFQINITHNLNKMAEEAGIYKHLWRPEELNIHRAGQLIKPLISGRDLLRSDPERFKKLNPKNGWGDYDVLLSAVERYLEACRAWPNSEVTTWR